MQMPLEFYEGGNFFTTHIIFITQNLFFSYEYQ